LLDSNLWLLLSRLWLSAAPSLVQYANVFISSEHAGVLQAIIFGLERAWNGSLAAADGCWATPDRPCASINITMQRVRELQRASTTMAPRSAMASNWRWQQLQYRATYDAFILRRLTRERQAEDAAMRSLAIALEAPSDQLLPEIEAAHVMLTSASMASAAGPEESRLGVGVEVLAARLFETISMQLSVPLYFAEYTVRGANLDTLRLPLTNAPYILDRLTEAAAATTNVTRRRAIVRNLTNWQDAEFYDDLGDPNNSPHLVVPSVWAIDPDYYRNPSEDRAIVKDQHWSKLSTEPPLALPLLPTAWQTTVNTFYQAELKMRYHGLEPAANYSVEVVYTVPNVYRAASGSSGDGCCNGAASVASFQAAVLTEIYLCNASSCQEILERNGRG
jgi:hypothetical protein